MKERTRSCFKLPLSSIVLGNAKSIRNKADELEACTCFLCRPRRADLIPAVSAKRGSTVRTKTRLFPDSILSAYSPNSSTEGAGTTTPQPILKHPERPKSYMRTLFLDFSCVFNTIQTHLMMHKLMMMDTSITESSAGSSTFSPTDHNG